MNYKWIKIGSIEFDSEPICLCWNVDNNRLLIALKNSSLQIWSYNSSLTDTKKVPKSPLIRDMPVKFSIDEETEDQMNEENETENDTKKEDFYEDEELNLFSKRPHVLLQKIWEKRLPTPVRYLKYSPDGLLFATLGENDRVVKVWQEVKSFSNLSFNTEIDSKEMIDYDCIYLSHPRAVTGISWRKISNYIPRGVISNSLLTSCKDNICRIWSETVLSDDGLTASLQEDASYTSIDNKSVRHKKNFLNKLHKIR